MTLAISVILIIFLAATVVALELRVSRLTERLRNVEKALSLRNIEKALSLLNKKYND